MSSLMRFAARYEAQQKTAAPDSATRWWMLAILGWVMALGGMAQYVTAPLSPFIIESLGLSKGQFGILSSAVVLSTILTTLIASATIDFIGVRLTILWGTVAMGSALILFFLPQSFALAFFLLFLSGFGYSAITPVTNNGVVEWFPRSQSGLALGLKQTGMPLGVALNSVFLPRLAETYGWEWATVVLGVIIVVTGIFAYILYRPGPYISSPTPASRLGAALLADTRLLLQDVGIRWLVLVGFSMAGLQGSVITFLVTHVQEATGLTAVQAAAFLGLSQIAGVVSRPLVGVMSDRAFGGQRKWSLVLTVVATVLVVVSFAFIGSQTPYWLISVIVLLVGGLTMGWIAPVFAMVIERAGRGLSGVASGLIITTNMTGVMLAPPVFGYLADLLSFRFALLLSAGWVGAVGLLFLLGFSGGDDSQVNRGGVPD